MNVFGTVTTVSRGWTPAAIRANRNASVPLPTPIEWRVPQNSANSRSKLSTSDPPMNAAARNAALNTETSSSSSST